MASLLFLSGAAGLVYQVAWVRLLALAFGVTVFAISTVLAAFMGGLAIGSFVGGHRADAVARPLRVYGWVELGVGITALLTPWAFSLLQGLYGGLAQVVDPSQAPLVAGGVRAVLAFAVLLVPTALMGATLPLAVRGARGQRREQDPTRGDAWTMGALYALNTTGAIVGCLLSGFVLIGSLGLAETIFAAATANGLAGLGGLILDALQPPLPLGEGGGEGASSADKPPSPALRATSPRGRGETLGRAALLAFAASGAISLAYEVVWTRILAVLFDSSIYGFVLMLATVLAGIAVGGALGGAFVRVLTSPRAAGLAFGWLELGIGLAAVLALIAFGTGYDLLQSLRGSGSFLERFVRTDLRVMAVLSILTVLPAALLMGATFPVAAPLVGRRLKWKTGSKVGRGIRRQRRRRHRRLAGRRLLAGAAAGRPSQPAAAGSRQRGPRRRVARRGQDTTDHGAGNRRHGASSRGLGRDLAVATPGRLQRALPRLAAAGLLGRPRKHGERGARSGGRPDAVHQQPWADQ